MGGFSLVDRDQKEVEPSKQNEIVLTFDYFKEHPEIDSAIREITAAEIVDRSKGDALTKVIAILQTTWFIIQCITRHIQRLSLTELELVTLALASLNAVTFVIWWHKPLGVQDPVRIYLEVAAPTDEPAPRQVGGMADLSKTSSIFVREISISRVTMSSARAGSALKRRPPAFSISSNILWIPLLFFLYCSERPSISHTLSHSLSLSYSRSALSSSSGSSNQSPSPQTSRHGAVVSSPLGSSPLYNDFATG